ncbi:hypothetical protein [Sulfitobacter sp. M13]|jgi:hypothetical protein|tara:strand:- start:97 stop:828 length:732 start_codon:yes stop_codon:yes gene_type:complete
MELTKRLLAFAMVSVLAAAESDASPYRPAPPYDPGAKWCEGDIPVTREQSYGPDGAITQVGPYYFRICRWGTAEESPFRKVMHLTYNPALVKGLSTTKVTRGLFLDSHENWESRRGQDLKNYAETVVETISGLKYKVLVHEWIGQANPFYLFDIGPKIDGYEVPPHFFKCNKPIVQSTPSSASCTIYLPYRQITARLTIMAKSTAEIPVDGIPLIAIEAERMIETADITDEYETLIKALPFIE